MEVIAICRPTLNPPYLGHTTTTLFDVKKLPTSVLHRIHNMKKEVSWMEVMVGNLRLEPAESIRIQEEMHKAELPLNQEGHYNVPEGCSVKSIHVYSGNKVYKTLPWTVYIRVALPDGGFRDEYYVWDSLPQQLQTRLLDAKGFSKYTLGLGEEHTDYDVVLFGDVQDEQSRRERMTHLNNARIHPTSLKDVCIALERSFLLY